MSDHSVIRVLQFSRVPCPDERPGFVPHQRKAAIDTQFPATIDLLFRGEMISILKMLASPSFTYNAFSFHAFSDNALYYQWPALCWSPGLYIGISLSSENFDRERVKECSVCVCSLASIWSFLACRRLNSHQLLGWSL